MSQKRDTFGGAVLAPQTEKATVRKLVLEQAQELKTVAAAYAGGLRAERDSYAKQRRQRRAAIRRTVFRGRGRRIDLVAILRKSRANKKPLWALLDPTEEIYAGNGGRDSDGDARIRNTRKGSITTINLFEGKSTGHANFQPVGIPPLPPRARAILTDPKIRQHAEWVGLLYQPQEWVLIDPDPAVVVEWKDAPDEYYVLAVWGGDRAEIMEFVD